MDSARQEVKVQQRPKDSFTIKEYAAQFGLTENQGRAELAKLLKRGQVKVYPAGGNKPSYYVLA